MDSGNRTRLFQVMENLDEIQKWRRNVLTLNQRLELNHPNAVLRNWKRAMEPDIKDDGKPTLRDSVVDLTEERDVLVRQNADLKAHIAEIEAARESGIYIDGDEPTLADKIVMVIGKERAALLIVELQKLISIAT
jgi:hypothetical protein